MIDDLFDEDPDVNGCFLTDDGTQAVQLCIENSIDVVLLDKNMPKISGEEVIVKIRRNPLTMLIPIIMLTGDSSVIDLQHLLNLGATDFMSKPFNAIELQARVHSAARSKRLTDHLDNAESVFYSLARMIESRDPFTGSHCERLASYGRILGGGVTAKSFSNLCSKERCYCP